MIFSAPLIGELNHWLGEMALSFARLPSDPGEHLPTYELQILKVSQYAEEERIQVQVADGYRAGIVLWLDERGLCLQPVAAESELATFEVQARAVLSGRWSWKRLKNRLTGR